MSTPRGKQKGSQFEREVARSFSLWWTRGEDPDALWRNLGIPSRGTGRRVERQYGDISSCSPRGHWFASTINVECKVYRDLDLLELIDKPEKKQRLILDFWKQCCGDAEASKRIPLLVMKRSFGEPVVACDRILAIELEVSSRVDLLSTVAPGVSLFRQEQLFSIDPGVFREVVEYCNGRKREGDSKS